MSGPKGYTVTVSPAVLRARAEESARARCRALLADRAAKSNLIEALDEKVAPTSVPNLDRAGLGALEDVERALIREIATLGERLTQARSAAVRRDLAARFVAESMDSLFLDVPAATSRRTSHRADALSQSVTRTLDLLAELDEARRAPLLVLADRVQSLIAEGRTTSADSALLRLQTDVEKARRQDREAARIRAAAADIVVRLADLPSAVTEPLLVRAKACTTQADLDSLGEDEHRVRTEWEAERDRRFVIEQTRAALRDIGYEVGTDFHGLAEQGKVVVNRPDLPDHGVEVTFTPKANRVLTQVVAYQATSAQRDKEVEELTCADLQLLREAWRRHGVEAALYHHTEPGASPVKHVSAPARRRTSTAAHERYLS